MLIYKTIDNIHEVIYNYSMNNYRRTKTTVSFINYHFVFCPRYRRKIFDIQDVEARFKEIVKNICYDLEIEVILYLLPEMYVVK
jgi:transposase IS200 family protein